LLKQKVVVNGKRAGQGFVCSRKELANALKSAPAFGVKIGNITVGRDGFAKFLQYMRGATQTVKIVPRDNILSVQFGSNCAVDIPNRKWIPWKRQADAEWFDFVQVEIGKRARYAPNVGPQELARAINRALITTSKTENNILLNGKDGILKVCSTDLYKITVAEVACAEDIEGIISRDDAKVIAKTLAKANRARVEVFAKEHSIYSSNGPAKAETKYIAVYADQVKFETQLQPVSLRQLLTPEELIPEAQGYALLDAREFQEIIKGIYMISDNEYTTTYPVHITFKESTLELVVYDNDEIVLATNIEAEGEGSGEICVDTKQIFKLLKDNKLVELVFPKDPLRPLLIKNTDYWHLVCPLKPSVSSSSSSEEKQEEQTEETREEVAVA